MLFGWYIGENIEMLYNYYVVIYYNGQPVLAGDFEDVIENLDEYYFNSRIKKLVRKDDILKFYLTY